jgi:hypothetical protein
MSWVGKVYQGLGAVRAGLGFKRDSPAHLQTAAAGGHGMTATAVAIHQDASMNAGATAADIAHGAGTEHTAGGDRVGCQRRLVVRRASRLGRLTKRERDGREPRVRKREGPPSPQPTSSTCSPPSRPSA